MKDWLIKKRVNYNLNADQSSFLANKNLRHALELYVTIYIQNQITKLFIEPGLISGKVYTEHCISKLMSVMYRLRIK